MSDSEGDKPAVASKYVIGTLLPIAVPLASAKLHSKVYKAVKKAASAKCLRRGVKEVVKGLRKGEKGLCVIAGDISPIDVISHLPVYCEENEVPYIFVSSKAELGASASTKRPTSCILISPKPGFSYQSKFDKIVKDVVAATPVH